MKKTKTIEGWVIRLKDGRFVQSDLTMTSCLNRSGYRFAHPLRLCKTANSAYLFEKLFDANFYMDEFFLIVKDATRDTRLLKSVRDPLLKAAKILNGYKIVKVNEMKGS